MVTAAATQCVSQVRNFYLKCFRNLNCFITLHQLLRKGGTRLMEPFMKLEVTIEDRYLHAVLGDLAQHRSDIIEITERHELKVSFCFYFCTQSS